MHPLLSIISYAVRLIVTPSFTLLFSTLLLLLLTQADLLPRVGRQQEDQQGHGGEEHTWD